MIKKRILVLTVLATISLLNALIGGGSFFLVPKKINIFLAPETSLAQSPYLKEWVSSLQRGFAGLAEILNEAKADSKTAVAPFPSGISHLHALIQKKALLLKRVHQNEEEFLDAVNSSYLTFLYFLADVTNTSFLSSEAYLNDPDKTEKVIEDLALNFNEVSLFFTKEVKAFRSRWIGYHRKMIGGILHEALRDLSSLQIDILNLQRREAQGIYAGIKPELNELDIWVRTFGYVNNNQIARRIYMELPPEEEMTTVDESNLFLLRSFLAEFLEISKKIEKKASSIQNHGQYSELEEKAKKIILRAKDGAEVARSLLSYYLHGYDFPLEEVSLNKIVKSAVEKVISPNPEQRSKTVSLQAGEDFNYKINAHPLSLRQAFYNLLQNAFKHADPNSVRVRVFEERGKAVVEISNDSKSGKFIPPEMLETARLKGMRGKGIPKLFQDDFTTSYGPGHGFGTKLAWQFVMMHDGRIEVRSNQAENGSLGRTVFTVKIPLLNKMVLRKKDSARLTLIVAGESIPQAGLEADLRALIRKFEHYEPDLELPSEFDLEYDPKRNLAELAL